MPIVSRVLEHLRPQTNGTVKVQERLTAASSKVFFHAYTAPSEAAALSTMNGRDLTAQLADADFSDLLLWVQDKNLPEDFDFTGRDLTLLEGEERLLVWFAGEFGAKAITIAWWLDGMNTGEFNAIRNRVGFTGDQGSIITQRFTFLFIAEPWYDVTVEVEV